MIPILGYFWNSTTFCVNMHNWYGLDMQLYYPEIIALWYVRDLIFMCIISPVVWYFIKKHPKATLSILTLIYLSGLWIGANGYNSQAIMFFSLGASFSIHGKDLVQWSYRHLWKFLPATLMLWLIVTIWNSKTQGNRHRNGRNQFLNHSFFYERYRTYSAHFLLHSIPFLLLFLFLRKKQFIFRLFLHPQSSRLWIYLK